MPRFYLPGVFCALAFGMVPPAAAQGCPTALQLSDRGSQLHIDIGYAAALMESGPRLGPNFTIFQDGNPPIPVPTKVEAAPSESSQLLVAALGSREQQILLHAGINYADFRLGLKEDMTGERPFPIQQADAEGQTVRLARIMLSEGAPDRQSWLAPDNSDENLSQWHLAANKDEDVWISCGYGRTNLLLSQRLPSAVTSCSVSPTTDPAGAPILSCTTR